MAPTGLGPKARNVTGVNRVRARRKSAGAVMKASGSCASAVLPMRRATRLSSMECVCIQCVWIARAQSENVHVCVCTRCQRVATHEHRHRLTQTRNTDTTQKHKASDAQVATHEHRHTLTQTGHTDTTHKHKASDAPDERCPIATAGPRKISAMWSS